MKIIKRWSSIYKGHPENLFYLSIRKLWLGTHLNHITDISEAIPVSTCNMFFYGKQENYQHDWLKKKREEQIYLFWAMNLKLPWKSNSNGQQKSSKTLLASINLYHSPGIISKRRIDDIFLIFPRKQDITFHANCLLRRQFAWNVISCFLGKNKKNVSKCHLLKILPRVLSVKESRSALFTINIHSLFVCLLISEQTNNRLILDPLHELKIWGQFLDKREIC